MDLQNFAQLVPGITVLDCRVLDCASVAARGGCFRYLRSTSCFYLPDRSSREHCANRAFGPGLDKAACLIDPCHRLEQQLQLRPLAEHDVDLRREFFEGDRMEHFPTMARLGVYDVLGVRR